MDLMRTIPTYQLLIFLLEGLCSFIILEAPHQTQYQDILVVQFTLMSQDFYIVLIYLLVEVFI